MDKNTEDEEDFPLEGDSPAPEWGDSATSDEAKARTPKWTGPMRERFFQYVASGYSASEINHKMRVDGFLGGREEINIWAVSRAKRHKRVIEMAAEHRAVIRDQGFAIFERRLDSLINQASDLERLLEARAEGVDRWAENLTLSDFVISDMDKRKQLQGQFFAVLDRIDKLMGVFYPEETSQGATVAPRGAATPGSTPIAPSAPGVPQRHETAILASVGGALESVLLRVKRARASKEESEASTEEKVEPTSV